MFGLSNNVRLKELIISSNEIYVKNKDQKFKIRDNISTFMLSNKTLQHINMTDCQINRETAEFLVSLFMLRPNMILLHTEQNPVMFDSVMI